MNSVGQTMQRPDLDTWSPAQGVEPMVRVGLCLLDDRRGEFLVTHSQGAHELVSEGPVSTPAQAHREADRAVCIRLASGRPILFRVHGDGVEVEGLGAARAWRIRPCASEVNRLVLHGLRAGRGFHWQREIDIEISGSVFIETGCGSLVVVAELALEEYLLGVITSEMSGECPLALLQCQAVAARSWLLARAERKHAADGFDYCNDDCCQRYQGRSAVSGAAIQAIADTRGLVLRTREGAIVDANYSKNCGGISEDPRLVWGVEKAGQRAALDGPADSSAARFFPISEANLGEFLGGQWLDSCDLFCSPRGVADSELPRYLGRVDDGRGYFRWRTDMDAEALLELLRRKVSAFAGDGVQRRRGGELGLIGEGGSDEWDVEGARELLELRVTRRGLSGRAVELAVTIRDACGARRTGLIRGQYAIRAALSETFLYSSAFQIEPHHDARGRLTRVELLGAGWGHGAGLCQIGALGRALKGHDYQTILRHYFHAVRIESVYR